MFSVDFQPVGRRGVFDSEKTLLECAQELGVDIVSICGGVGSCERCKVQVVEGQVSEVTMDEEWSLSPHELTKGYRLACRTYPQSSVKIYVPPESLTAPQRTQIEGIEVDVTPVPVVRGMHVKLTVPTLSSPEADVRNLWNASGFEGGGSIDYEASKTLSPLLREHNWQINAAVRGDEIIAFAASAVRWLGMAVDIGTTKVAGYLIDLESGRLLVSKGIMNPQIAYGEDVVSRIVAASRSRDHALKLQKLIVEALNQLAMDMCVQIGADPTEIADIVLVANTAIHHLLLDLPVKQLGLSPYIPVLDTEVEVKAREIGLLSAAGAYVYMPPIVAGYVGADHVAMLLATNLGEDHETALAIDIGTNTEICLNHKGRLTSVSCASGPAFEGAHIKHGMRAAPGAIEYVRIEDGRVEVQTIGSHEPAGICGSGLLDTVAQLRLNNIVDYRGRMGDHSLVRSRNGLREFVLAQRTGLDAITITQMDVRELQLAKAAIRLGIRALVEAEEIEEVDIQKIYIAGAFGSFIDVSSAIAIGLLPPLSLETFEQVGNAAGSGARIILISETERERANRLARTIGYIELAKIPNFSVRFAEATYL